MAILGGRKRFKEFLLTSTGYILMSRRTTSDAVVIGDGTDDDNTLEKKLTEIDSTLSTMNTTIKGKAPTTHTQAASTITTGTLAGKVLANSSATTGNDAQLRNIQVSTTDLTAGTSPLTTGQIYVVYE